MSCRAVVRHKACRCRSINYCMVERCSFVLSPWFGALSHSLPLSYSFLLFAIWCSLLLTFFSCFGSWLSCFLFHTLLNVILQWLSFLLFLPLSSSFTLFSVLCHGDFHSSSFILFLMLYCGGFLSSSFSLFHTLLNVVPRWLSCCMPAGFALDTIATCYFYRWPRQRRTSTCCPWLEAIKTALQFY